MVQLLQVQLLQREETLERPPQLVQRMRATAETETEAREALVVERVERAESVATSLRKKHNKR